MPEQAVPELTNEQQVSTKFADIRTRLDEVAKANAAMTFDYEDPADNKAARSQVHKLRSLNGMIDKAHKTIKADALAQCRLIDGAKKELKERVADMIEVHAVPIKAIEDREAARQAAITKALDDVRCYMPPNATHEQALKEFNRLCDITLDTDVYQERIDEATEILDHAIDHAQTCVADAKKREAEAAELEALRKKTAEQEKQIREQKIRDEAAAKAKREAEEAAQRKIDEANARAKDAEQKVANSKCPKCNSYTDDCICDGVEPKKDVFTEFRQRDAVQDDTPTWEQQAIQFIKDNAGSINWIAVAVEGGGSVTFGKNGITRTDTKGKS